MAPKESLQRPIIRPKQLLVEGRTAEIFFREWIESTDLVQEMQVRDFGSVSDLTAYLKVFAALKNVREKVTAIAVIRDAEQQNPAEVFESVCASFTTAGLPRPAALNRAGNQTPRTAVFVLPDCNAGGMLETLCWQVLQSDSALEHRLACVAQYLDCVRGTAPIHNETKARIWTYLAGFGKFDPLLGHSARAKMWDWGSPPFQQLFAFLRAV